MDDLKAYLAANYMSGPKADAILARSTDPTIKKKRKKVKNEDYIGGSSTKGDDSSGLGVRDEDEWKVGEEEIDLEGEDAPVLGKELATFKKSKSQWATVGASTIPVAGPSGTSGDDAEAKPEAQENGSTETVPTPKVQITKRKGGLRTAAQLQAEEAARQEAERERLALIPDADGTEDGGVDPTQTIHRDASGRILDVEKLKEEERKREEEEKRKALEREEWSKGFTQRRDRERRARDEMDMRGQDVARHADDVRMNQELREVERWNDPAAGFITKKKKQKGPRRPKYQGAWAPNRYGIPPGFRWDGVDRSNGFEKKFFQYQNAASRQTYEANQWSMEDM